MDNQLNLQSVHDSLHEISGGPTIDGHPTVTINRDGDKPVLAGLGKVHSSLMYTTCEMTCVTHDSSEHSQAHDI